MQQRIIWFILFLLGLSMTFYMLIIDDKRSSTMATLEEKDFAQDGDVKSTLEVYRRLETKWIGTSQHLQTLQDDLASQIKRYDTKMDSIRDDFLRVNNSIENAKEYLTKKINEVREDLDGLSDLFKAYKRSTNRKLDDMMITTLPRIEDDLKSMSDSLDVILSIEDIQREIKKLENK